MLADFDRIVQTKGFLFFAGLLIAGGVWWINGTCIDVRIAYSGFTPVEWNLFETLPSHFVKDFPTGLAGYNTSLFMHIYPLLSRTLHVSVETLMPWVIAMEVIALAAAVMAMVRSLFPGALPVLLFSAVALAISGFLPRLDISMFGFANFMGLYYSAAEVFRLFAIIFALRGKLAAAFVFATLSTLVHPLIGAVGLVFILGVGLGGGGQRRWLGHGLGLLGYGLSVIPWFYAWTIRTNYSGTAIPPGAFYDLTELCGAHWYPVRYGMFAGNPPNILYFLGYLLLFVHYSQNGRRSIISNRKMAAGVTAMIGLVILGIFFSVAKLHPVLVKLALHRAGGVVLLVGLPYVVKGLWEEITGIDRWRSVAAILVLISPFLLNPGFPLSLVVYLSWNTWWGGLRWETSLGKRVGALVLLTIVVVLGIFSFHHYWQHLLEKFIKWHAYLLIVTAIYAFLGITYLLVARIFRRDFFATSAVILVLFSSLLWVYRMRPVPAHVALARSYKDVQLWARDKTPINSIFMVDPGIYYGWRAYSQRSSFGNLRDWIYNWAYSSNGEHYREGIRRFDEFSLDYKKYLRISPSYLGFDYLSDDVQERYYAFDDTKRNYMCRAYGINYFVMVRKNMVGQSKLEMAYENSNFIVLKGTP